NPNHVGATTWAGVMGAAVEGLYDDAIALCRRAYALDPLSPLAAALVTNALLMAGRYAEAEEAGRSGLQAFPHAWNVRYYLGATLIRLGRADEAVATLEVAVEPARRYAWLMTVLIEALVAAGDSASARPIYEELAQAPQPIVMALGAAAGALGDLDA